MRLLPLALLLAGGCGFQVASEGAAIDGAITGDASDIGDGSGSAGTRDLPHVPPSQELPGSEPWTISGTVTLDTSGAQLQSSAPLPATAGIVAQDGGGPELAVIRASTVTVTDGAKLVVGGTRPLVIVATTITVRGTIDASAVLATPGAGGKPAGATAAMNGVHTGSYGDSAGGGGGFTGTAGMGGSANTTCGTVATGGASGAAFGTPVLATLEGGGGGGTGSKGSCSFASGGGGGGAVQLSATAAVTIELSGRVLAGGGGGKGGVFCNNDDAGAGGGGGGGGAIYLDAPAITLLGQLAANGGAGGGGGCGPGGSGADGANGGLSAPAMAGGPGGSCGVRGGNGAAGSMAAQPGGSNGCDGNGGGGGGAVGRIVLHHAGTTPVTGAGISTPAATDVTF